MKNIAPLLLFLGLIMACVKEGPVGPKGPDGPPYTWPPGDITGFIELHDQFGNVMGMRDSVLLHTHNADSIFRAYTDSNGHFRLKDLPPGNYDISVSKPGFDSLHMYIEHAGGKRDKFTGITAISQHLTTRLVSLNVSASHINNYFLITAHGIFEWPQPFSNNVINFNAYLDTSSSRSPGGSLSTLVNLGQGYVTNIDSVRGELQVSFSLAEQLVSPSTVFYVTIVITPPYFTHRSWFNYATEMQVPYPYVGDSIKAYSTQPQ